MNRNRLVLMLLLIGLIPSLAFGEKKDEERNSSGIGQAEETGEEKLRTTYMNDKIQFTVNAGMGLSAYQWQFTGGFQLDFNANAVVGAGLKTTVDYGIDYGNLNINTYLLYKIWWFYFGPGVSFIVQDMTIPSDDPKYAAAYNYPSIASLAITAGFRFPFARIGPGHLTMDLSVDWYQTDIPVTEPAPPAYGQVIQELINGSTYAFKFGARVGYTF